MTIKQQWEQYLKELQAYQKAVKKYIKTLSDGDVSTQDEGSQPKPPPVPPPPTHS